MTAQGSNEVRKAARRRIEINQLVNDDGSYTILLQDLSFGPGVGWYPQRTIQLDSQQVDALLRKLCCARQSPSNRRGCNCEQLVPLSRLDTPEKSQAEVIDLYKERDRLKD